MHDELRRQHGCNSDSTDGRWPSPGSSCALRTASSNCALRSAVSSHNAVSHRIPNFLTIENNKPVRRVRRCQSSAEAFTCSSVRLLVRRVAPARRDQPGTFRRSRNAKASPAHQRHLRRPGRLATREFSSSTGIRHGQVPHMKQRQPQATFRYRLIDGIAQTGNNATATFLCIGIFRIQLPEAFT